jgi:hypothetical protein
MLALRYVYVLALAIWLGGMVGELFGTTNARFLYLAYACGGSLVVTLVAMAVLGPRPAAFAIRLILSAAMLLVALYSGLALRADALPQLAMPLMTLNLAGALVLLYWEARGDHL